jgi:hypothetical protein
VDVHSTITMASEVYLWNTSFNRLAWPILSCCGGTHCALDLGLKMAVRRRWGRGELTSFTTIKRSLPFRRLATRRWLLGCLPAQQS